MNLDLLFFSTLPEDRLFLFFTYFPKIELFFSEIWAYLTAEDKSSFKVIAKSIEIWARFKAWNLTFSAGSKGLLASSLWHCSFWFDFDLDLILIFLAWLDGPGGGRMDWFEPQKEIEIATSKITTTFLNFTVIWASTFL